ncbi:hypothetical protein N9L68_08455 [bacterium]|nr:hypothetical protein [bacterium]
MRRGVVSRDVGMSLAARSPWVRLHSAAQLQAHTAGHRGGRSNEPLVHLHTQYDAVLENLLEICLQTIVDKRIGARRVLPNHWPDVCAPPPLPWDDYDDGPWDVTDKPGIGSEPPLGVPESPRHHWGAQLASGHVSPPAVHGEGRDPRLDLPGSCLVNGALSAICQDTGSHAATRATVRRPRLRGSQEPGKAGGRWLTQGHDLIRPGRLGVVAASPKSLRHLKGFD